MNKSNNLAVYSLEASNLDDENVQLSVRTRGGIPTSYSACAPSYKFSLEEQFFVGFLAVEDDNDGSREWDPRVLIYDKLIPTYLRRYLETYELVDGNDAFFRIYVPDNLTILTVYKFYERVYRIERNISIDEDVSDKLMIGSSCVQCPFGYEHSDILCHCKYVRLIRAVTLFLRFGVVVPLSIVEESISSGKIPNLMEEGLQFLEDASIVALKKHLNDIQIFEAEMNDEIDTRCLSDLNKLRYRKLCRGIINGIMMPEKNKGKKKIFKLVRREKSSRHLFEAEMFTIPSVPHKIEEGQFEVISELLNRFVDQMENFGVKMKETTGDDIRESGKLFGDGIASGIGSSAAKLFKKLSSILSNIVDDGTLSIVVGAILLEYFRRNADTKSTLLVLGVIGGLLAYLHKERLFEAMESSFVELLFKSSQAVPAETLEMDVFFEAEMFDPTLLSDCLVLFLGYCYMPNLGDSKSNLLKYLGDMGRSYSGTETTISVVIRIVQKILDYCAESVGWKSFSLLSSYIPQVDKWIEDARASLTDIRQGRGCHTREMYDKLISLEDKAYELLSKHGSDKKNFGVSNIVRPILGEVSRMRIQLEHEGVGQHKMRQAPVIISLSGESQIGKSRMLRPFVASLLAMVLPPEQLESVKQDLDSHVYSWQPELVYADGYTGQTVCFMDEKDLVHPSLLGPENANTHLIRFGNVFPNILHMAGIEQKGNVYFRSKIVICTTNVDKSIEGARDAVRYPDAVANRIHLEVAVRVKREYADPAVVDKCHQRYWTLDKSKLPEDGHFIPDTHDYVILERRPIEGAEGQREYFEKEIISYDELLRRAAAIYKKKEMEARQIPGDDDRAFLYGARLRMEAQMGDPEGELKFSELITLILSTNYRTLKIRNSEIFLKFRECANGREMFRDAEAVEFFKELIPDERFGELRDDCLRVFSGERFKIVSRLNSQGNENLRNFLHHLCDCEIIAQENSSLASFNEELFLWTQRSWELWKEKLNIMWKKLCSFEIPSIAWILIRDAKQVAIVVALYHVAQKAFSFFFPGEEKNSERERDTFIAEYTDSCMVDIFDKIWNNSYYSMSYDEDGEPFGFGFFVRQNTFLFCTHYVNVFKARGYQDDVVFLKNQHRTIRVPVSTFLQSQEIGRDISRVEVTNTVLHPDITHLFCGRETFLKRSRGEALCMRKIGSKFVPTLVKFKVAYNMSYSDGVGGIIRQPETIVYESVTAKGFCGLPLFLNDSTTRARKFIGFHVAGDGASGMANIFDFGQEFAAEASYVPRTMEIVGRVDRAPTSSGESMIRRSPLYGAWGPAKKAPAHLRSFINEQGERVSPMLRAIARYDKPLLIYDQSLVDACARAAVLANTDCFLELPKKISLQEAIQGVPGEPYLDALNRSTSPGYPWNMRPRPGYKGKERFLGTGVDIDLSGPDFPELIKEVEEAHEKLLRGERPMFYFSDSLKDETLKLEKVKNGDTRLFCPSPIVYQILNRMYFADFHRRFMESRIRGEHAVGINVYSDEWNMLAKKHLIFGNENIVAGDFKSFDASQSAQILKAIGEYVIQSFEDREHDNVRRLLWMNVYDSHHIFGKDIIRWLQSLPSGDPGTTNINCMFVGTIMRMCFVNLRGGDISQLREFSQNVALTAYGDDHIVSVSDVVKESFNQQTITEQMSLFGLTYTSEDKSTNPPPVRPLEQIEFLKRSFRIEPRYGRYCAPLRLETILEMPYWSKKTFYDDIWRVNLENAIKELSLHEPEIFSKWSEIMLRESYRLTQYAPLIVERNALLDELVKKEIVYKAQMDDKIVVRNASSRTGWNREKILSQMTVPDTALEVKSWHEKRCLPTKMGLSKGIYLGQTQCDRKSEAAYLLRYWSANNNDNNLMDTVISQANDMACTTQILNEAGVKTVTRSQLSDIPQGLLKATQVGYDQSSIYDFFKKPVRLSTFEWNSQSAGSVLYNASLPQDVFSIPIYRDKLRGFYGFRGTMVIRVQVNGTKFQSGRLLLVFIPQGNVANSYPGMRLRSLRAATQLPRVELDLGTETEIIMEVPYVSPTPYYNLATQEGPYGRAALLVYEPLATGTGSAVADVTMWIHFKDVEMVTPAFTAEMGDRRPKKKKIKNPSEQELEKMTDGPISGGLTMMAKAASSFAKVPLLTNLAGPASWALNCMAGVASAFGYSKPTSEEATTKNFISFGHNLQNHNGVDNFPNMGLEASNKLSIMPGFAGTEVDEMSLNHLLQIPSYVARFAWTTSNPADTVLWNVVPSPQLLRSSSIVNFWSTWDLTPLDYFSSLFAFWRGSFVVTLKFVKTQYHSGRLLIAWSPAGDFTVDQSSYVLREIVDLRETNEVRFVIPYVSTSQYLPTSDLSEDNGGIGRLKIFVLNELVCPDSVSSTVGVIAEFSGGPDFEVMCPRPFNRAPLIVNTWQAQMGDVVPASSRSENPNMNQGLISLGSSIIDEQSLEPALYCVGERCNSILQLLKRYCRLRVFDLLNPIYGVDIRPFVTGACYSLDAVGVPNTLTGDYVTLFSYCFAYSRGSVRVMLALNSFDSSSKSSGGLAVYPSTELDTCRDNLDMQRYPGVSLNYQPGFSGYPSGCTIPAYQRLHARLNRVSTTTSLEPVDVYSSPMRASINNVYGSTSKVSYLFRAAGDDYTLGYFIGVPLVTSSIALP